MRAMPEAMQVKLFQKLDYSYLLLLYLEAINVIMQAHLLALHIVSELALAARKAKCEFRPLDPFTEPICTERIRDCQCECDQR